MVYRGHIQNGVAVLDEGITLPDGTPVRVEVAPGANSFWQGKTVAVLAEEQGVSPVRDLPDFAVDWPSEDTIDELLATVREARRS